MLQTVCTFACSTEKPGTRLVAFIASKIVIHQPGTLGWCITILLAVNVTDSQPRTQSLKRLVVLRGSIFKLKCLVYRCVQYALWCSAGAAQVDNRLYEQLQLISQLTCEN